MIAPLEITEETDDNSNQRLWIWPQSVLAIACLIGFWPLLSQILSGQQTLAPDLNRAWETVALKNWQPATQPDWPYHPKLEGPVAESIAYFNNGNRVVGLYQASFGDELQGAELVSHQNSPISQEGHHLSIIDLSKSTLATHTDQPVDVDRYVLRGYGADWLVLRWYRIGSWSTSNPYRAKLMQLYKRLSGNTEPEILVMLWMPVADKPETSLNQLQELGAMLNNDLFSKS